MFMIDILEKIYILREKNNWTEYRLAMEAGLPQGTISSWYTKNKTPSFASIEKVCKAFGLTVSQFFAENYDFIDLSDEEKEFLKKWHALSEDEKKIVMRILNS